MRVIVHYTHTNLTFMYLLIHLCFVMSLLFFSQHQSLTLLLFALMTPVLPLQRGSVLQEVVAHINTKSNLENWLQSPP